MFVEDESCPVYNTSNEEEESRLVYDTDIEDVIEEEEGLVGKGRIGGEEDNIEDFEALENQLVYVSLLICLGKRELCRKDTIDANPIRTLGGYSKPSHEGYRNTIELPVGNNIVPLRSDTIRLVQNGCSFHELRSEDPNQHLKDFLKLVDSLDLDGENRERTLLHLNQGHETTDEMEDKVKSKEEVEEETKEEAEEEEEGNPKHFNTFLTINELRYHEWLLKNPRPPCVKSKIKIRDVNNVKFSCMIGQFNKKQAYLDLKSPVNIMSRIHLVQIWVVDLENQEVVVRHVVVEMDWRASVANCPSLIHRGYFVTYVVDEVLERVLLLEMDFDRDCGSERDFFLRGVEGVLSSGCSLLEDVSKVVYEKCGEGVKKMMFEGNDYKVKVKTIIHHSHPKPEYIISTVDLESKILSPMGFKGIAKVDRGWFLGCDQVLDCKRDGEEDEQ
nr:MAK10-like protein [Tanacetum cinerariifolium]